MSTVTVVAGALIRIPPDAEKVISFDFDTLNLPVGVALTNSGPDFGITVLPLQQRGATALTFDNAGLTNTNRRIQARFLGTTATLGDRYRIQVIGTTDEMPSQTKPYSVDVLIEGD